MLRLFFIIKCGIARFLCAMHLFKVRHYLHPLGSLCAKFCLFATSIAELAHAEKLHIQSLNYPAYLMPCEPKRFGIQALQNIK